jgi:hypothetical protein|nr:MAG TPA: hypothetical protein [Caudoviricetes sp.]
MTNEKLFELLKKETNMTDHDIQKHIKDGIVIYEDNEDGFVDFKNDALAGLNDEEDIPDMWDKLEIVGDYRMVFAS